jgi:diguanylate cyclase (GGDEF)-like protein
VATVERPAAAPAPPSAPAATRSATAAPWEGAVVPLLAGLALFAAGWPGPTLGLTHLPWLLAATLTALHRPLGGGGAGLATLALAPLAARGELFAAGVLGGVAVFAAGLLDWPVRLAAGIPVERRGLHRRLEQASATALQVIAAGGVWWWLHEPLAARAAGAFPLRPHLLGAAAAALVHLAVGLAIVGLIRRRLPADRPWGPLTRPLLVEAAGWLIAAPVVSAFAVGGAPLGAPLLGLAALLALEAARADLDRLRLARRLAEVEEAQLAGARLLADEGNLTTLLGRIRAECRAALPVQWFELTLEAGPTAPGRWHARDEGPLDEGPAEPPAHPPALRGIHRRRGWTVIERALRGASGVRGELRLWCDSRQVRRRSVELLDAMLPSLVASLERSLLDLAARTDALTGLASRRVLDERLPAAVTAAREDGGRVAVILLDVDHFKRINDQFGHGVGDQALQAVARAVRTTAADAALCCRLGGEELVLLVPGASGEVALRLAERLRQAVEAVRLSAGETPVTLTVSAGVAGFPELHVRRPEELLELADEALYVAKRTGRNRCLLALGQGSYESVDGELVREDGNNPPAGDGRAPTFFAR